jgi:integrase
LERVPQFEFLKVEPPDVDARAPAEVEALLAACPPIPWRAFVLTKVLTGMRFSEITALEWSDVDLDAAMLKVSRGQVLGHVDAPKSRRSRRIIPLTSEVVQALRSLPRESERVFTYLGRSIKYNRAWYHINKFCKQAGIRHTSFHPLRHTFATDLFARGASPKAVQDLMGHEKIEMTLRYTHLPEEVLRQTINLLERKSPTVWAVDGQSRQISGSNDGGSVALTRQESALTKQNNA